MNVEIGAEAALFPEKEYISGILLAVHAWTNELYRHQSICRIFLKIYLQKNFPALICLPADELCQLLGW